MENIEIKCGICKNFKTLDKFHKRTRGKYGVANNCKECGNEKSRKYHETYKEGLNKIARLYYAENREKVSEKMKLYYQKNREKILERTKLYHQMKKSKR